MSLSEIRKTTKKNKSGGKSSIKKSSLTVKAKHMNAGSKGDKSESTASATTKLVSKPKKPSATVLKNIHKLRTDGAGILDNLTQKAIQKILESSRVSYYNDDPIITDNEYDILKEYMETKYPENAEAIAIGADVRADKVKLPYFMGSMDKIKPDTNAIDRWKKKYAGPYVISSKLDGVSGLLSTEGGVPKLYTRGNGKVGQDITKFLIGLNMPKPETLPHDVVVRGEFIIRQDIFKVYYGADFSNARNFVSGVINSKSSTKKKLGHVDFVAYELIKPELPPSKQFEYLEKLGFIASKNEIRADVTNATLSEMLVEWRSSYEYEMDGIICCDDNIYPRNDGNPEYAFAFKMVLGEQIAEAKVLAVEWSPSKDGLLKPRIRIEPVVLGGARIEYATAFNADFVVKNKLGVGAKIKMIRSGDVIPYIMDVLEPAEHVMMPNEDYEWYGDTHVDIVLKDKGSNKAVLIKNLVFFFKTLEIDGLGPGNVERIEKSGFDTIPKILAMKPDDLRLVDGFKEKMAQKVHTNIHAAIDQAKLVDIMAASNLFGHGMGKRKMVAILDDYPDALTSDETDDQKIDKIMKIKSMAQKSARLFVCNIKEFLAFLDEIGLSGKLVVPPSNKSPIDVDHPLYKKSVVMTGFRDAELSKKLDKVGAKIGSSVSKNTFVLVVKTEGEKTGKVDQAESLGVVVMSVDKFKQLYF